MGRQKTRQAKQEERASKIRRRLANSVPNRDAGTGIFIFKNNTQGELELARPSLDGSKIVPRGATWRGNDYFMYMLKTNEALLVDTIEHVKNKEILEVENKLILDQPETVTTKGAVEQVEVSGSEQKPLKEITSEEESKEKDKLLTEDPLEGVQIIYND